MEIEMLEKFEENMSIKSESEKSKKKKKKVKKKKNKKKSKKKKNEKENSSSNSDSSSSMSSDSSSLLSEDIDKDEEIEHKNYYDPDIIGPRPLKVNAIAPAGKNNYGSQLLPGEGSAIAHYIQTGKRIPRRGEVGLTSEEIEKYENLGYVMSGSRHKRMTAVRLRKEQQVYSIEEKRALTIFNYEQKIKKEHKLIEDMQQLLQNKLKKIQKK